MYDAWAAYDERAVGTQLAGALRRPASERTIANKEQAISYAAYRALTDVLPVDTNSVYIPLMKGAGPADTFSDTATANGMPHPWRFHGWDATTMGIRRFCGYEAPRFGFH